MKLTSAAPSAARLTSSLRDIGYDFDSAVADLVDNSIAAGATDVAVEIGFAGAGLNDQHRRRRSRIERAAGMTEALRFGSRRTTDRRPRTIRARAEDGVAVAVPACVTVVSQVG